MFITLSINNILFYGLFGLIVITFYTVIRSINGNNWIWFLTKTRNILVKENSRDTKYQTNTDITKTNINRPKIAYFTNDEELKHRRSFNTLLSEIEEYRFYLNRNVS